MSNPVFVAGVGMVPFSKPGPGQDYRMNAASAIRLALSDSGLDFADIQQIYAGFVYADSCAGQHAAYAAGMSGVPVINVNNNCATGSTALFLANQAVASGAVDCVLAFGFEQMNPGPIGAVFHDQSNPLGVFDHMSSLYSAQPDLPLALRCFGGAGLAHMRQYGTRLSTFAKIRAKASRHASRNPLALFRTEITEEDVLSAPVLWEGVMTRLMACPPTCGAAAAIVCSRRFAARHGLTRPVRILAQSMTTDRPASFESGDMRMLVGYGMTQEAAGKVYETAGIGPEDINVVELHDCFAHNELISYEALGLCGEGEAEPYVCSGKNTYGGQHVVNPSGGLLSKGHPLGATGLAQCHELVHQLRQTAQARQVDNARFGLQHNIGLGGACVVTLYQA